MLYLPAAASRTTRNLRRAGQAAAVIAGLAIVAIVIVEARASDRGPGAHFSLYASAILASVVAASCLSFAFARHLIGQMATAVCAELARVVKRLDRQDETDRQLVTEMAKLKDAVRVGQEELADRVGVVVAEALVVARREGEMRGFARGLAAARALGDGDTGPIPG